MKFIPKKILCSAYMIIFLAPKFRPDEDSQPNGHEQEDCTMIKLENLQSSANWHDISCASRETSQFICDIHAEGRLKYNKIIYKLCVRDRERRRYT